MASFYGYMILIVGLSLLLAIAGFNTGTGNLMEKYFKFNPNQDHSFNSTTLDSSNFGANGSGDGSDSFNWVFTLFGIGSIVAGVGIALATKDVGQGLKSGFVGMIFTLGATDFKAILDFAYNDSAFGGLLAIVAFIVYIPLAIGYLIAGINWVGGSQ